MKYRSIRQEDHKKVVVELLNNLLKTPDHDDPMSVKKVVALLSGLLRINTFVPPTMEIMAFFKQQKPTLYYATKKSITTTSNLNMLFQLEADPDLAIARLREYLES